jgi:hypothetical protein
MACPCFYPVDRIAQTETKSPPAPLGDIFTGVCRARAEGEWLPDPVTARQLCNFGYARARCPRFPGDGADAVRFSISKDQDGFIGIYWVVEKNHLPWGHGPLEYSREAACFTLAHPDARLARQAQAYVSSYLRRKGEAVNP